MPARMVDLDTTNKSKSVFDMDQLRNLDTGEKARIVILDERPRMAVVHYIKTGSGDDTKGRYIECIGDWAVVQATGKDEAKCPACAVAEMMRDARVSMGRRRFVWNCARYRTTGKGDVIVPISLALIAWIFSDDKFNTIVDLKTEWGDLRKKDIIVTCKAKQYQTMEIGVGAGKPKWSTDAGATAQWKDLMAARNQEIDRLLGSVLSYEQLERLCQEALPRIGATDMGDATDSGVASAIEALEKLPVQDGDVVHINNDREPIGAAVGAGIAESMASEGEDIDFADYLKPEKD